MHIEIKDTLFIYCVFYMSRTALEAESCKIGKSPSTNLFRAVAIL